MTNLYLRSSCFACPSKCGKSGSDLTLGDFGGVEHVMPEFDDEKGVSCVLVNTEKGMKYSSSLVVWKCNASYDDVYRYNTSLEESVSMNPKRQSFYAHYGVIARIVSTLTRNPFILKCKIFVYKILVKLQIRC